MGELVIDTEEVNLYRGDCREVMAGMPDNSVDAIVTDPPYELGFMGKRWDRSGIAYDPEVWAQAFRVLKPGGHALVFGGTRTWHRVAVAVEDAGFEIRDSLAWLYGSGFPKSMDVSKAIDGLGGVAPETREFAEAYARMVRESPFSHADIDRELGVKSSSCYWARTDARRTFPPRRHWERLRDLLTIPETFDAIYDAAERVDRVIGEPGANAVFAPSRRVVDAGTPVTETAKAWHGWGTALKPAFEPVVVARKPLEGTVAANVLEHGTGALNIDASRIATSDKLGGGAEVGQAKRADEGWNRPWMDDEDAQARHAETVRANVAKAESLGRFPSNVLLDESQAAELDKQSGVSVSRQGKPRSAGAGEGWGMTKTGTEHDDSGGASRFFYVAKAGKDERPVVDGHQHATVKPLALMRYLVRMITPPGGRVLDMFAGSGTTGEAAVLEGFDVTLIELDEDGTHIPLIRQRLGKPLTPAMF